MDAEILSIPPISGSCEEHVFHPIGDSSWVKFVDSDYQEWCGVFNAGWNQYVNFVQPIPDTPIVLVIAGGQGHYVEVNQRKIIANTEWDNIESAIFNEHTGRVVISDGLCLAMIEGFKTTWKSQRISLDGISFKESNGHIIKGTLNDCTQDGSEFSFDVLTRKITGKWLFYSSVG